MENIVKEIATAMKDINLLSSYDLPKEKIIAYSEKLFSLYPSITGKIVEEIMNDFFIGAEEYTPSKGIRNFTQNLENRNVRNETPEEKARRKYCDNAKNAKIFG